MTDNNQQPTTPPVDVTGTQPGGATPNQATTPERTFTQADLDRIVTERLKRQEESIKAQFANYPALQEQASKWAEYEESKKTELQKIQDAAKAKEVELQNELIALKTDRETLSATVRTAQVKAAVIAEASAQGITGKQLEATYKLLDVSKLTFDDKGEITNAAVVVEETIKHYELKPNAPQPQSAKPGTKINPTNPAGASTEPDLSWHPLNRRNESSFQRGGVIPPVGEK